MEKSDPGSKIQNRWQRAEAAGWFSAIAELRPISVMGHMEAAERQQKRENSPPTRAVGSQPTAIVARAQGRGFDMAPADGVCKRSLPDVFHARDRGADPQDGIDCARIRRGRSAASAATGSLRASHDFYLARGEINSRDGEPLQL